MRIHPGLDASVLRHIREDSMSGVSARNRRKKIIGAIGRNTLGCLLAVVGMFGQIAIRESWNELLPVDRFHRRPADVDLAAAMMRSPVDRLCGDFRLEN